jgi:hypothetical protein
VSGGAAGYLQCPGLKGTHLDWVCIGSRRTALTARCTARCEVRCVCTKAAFVDLQIDITNRETFRLSGE